MYFVLMFISSVFYPLERVPTWLRTVAMVNPLSWHSDVLRFMTLGVGDLQTILLEVAGFILFLLVSFSVAIRALQKTL